MDTIVNCLEFAVVLACIFIGSRYGGVGLGYGVALASLCLRTFLAIPPPARLSM